MSEIAIRADALSKMYRITAGRTGPSHRTLRDALTESFKALLKRGEQSGECRDFWALRDVGFELREGERVGIIGRNGAGKSTLLKVLSRIVTPTSGRAVVRGRLASLLEVGTGFHPELSGRENIYLNGTLLNMTRADIDRVFDAIVDFAGVGDHLEVPVKRYSSGMYTRLAFAVAAHLEPDILIVDEVLAVGDAAFQKKCIDRMNQMQNEGRTYLFVSHNMALVSALCNKAMVMEAGRVHTPLVETGKAIAAYNESLFGGSMADLEKRTDRQGAGNVIFTEVRCGSTPEALDASVNTGTSLFVRMALKTRDPTRKLSGVHLALSIVNELGHTVGIVSSINEGPLHTLSGGGITSTLELPRLRFGPGSYTLNVMAQSVEGGMEDWLQGAAFFRCELGDYFGNGSQIPVGHMCAVPEARWLGF